MVLSDSERISFTLSAVLIQYTRVTDGHTGGIGVAYTRYSMYAVVRKKRLLSIMILRRIYFISSKLHVIVM